MEGKSPDEALAKIVALEALVASMRPASLTASQIAAARSVLAKVAPSGVKIAKDKSGVDNSRIPAQLAAAFVEAKWVVHEALLFGMDNSVPSGIALFVSEVPAFLQQGVAIKNVLDAAGVTYSIFKFPIAQDDQLPQLCFTHASR